MARSGGKTIDTWKHEAQGVTVPIKMNAGGNFIAELNGATFHSDSIKEIRLKLKEAVELAHSLTWIPVISIEVAGKKTESVFPADVTPAIYVGLDLTAKRWTSLQSASGSQRRQTEVGSSLRCGTASSRVRLSTSTCRPVTVESPSRVWPA